MLAPTGRTFHKLRLALAVCVALLALTGRAAATPDGQCGTAAKAWAHRCAASRHMSVKPVFCVGDRAVFQLHTQGVAPLRVEISRAKSGPTRIVPVGDFPNWEQLPEARRALLDKARACAAASFNPEAFKPVVPTAAARGGGSGPPGLPWRALVAAALALVLLVISARKVRRRRFLVVAGGAVALAAATFVFRRALFPPAFFHQNGQGPDWINYALGHPSDYGPGFFQLFGLAAHAHPASAERAVFLEAGLLAAVQPVCVLLIARASAARRLLAWTLAVATLAAPGLARLADSESYFGICTTLLLLAGATLASGGREGRVRSWAFLSGAAAAGLFIAQAALVHPVCWLPAAVVPLVAFTGRGSLRRRAKLLVAAGLVIALVVAASAGPFILRELQAQARWATRAERDMPRSLRSLAEWLLVLVVVLALLWRRRRPRRLFIYVALLPLAAAPGLVAARTLSPQLPLWIRQGWWALLLPAGAALGAAVLGRAGSLLGGRRAERLLAAATAVTLGLWFATSWKARRELPTDALEARFVESWRNTLPPRSAIIYLQRAGQSITVIPVYIRHDAGAVAVLAIRGDNAPFMLERSTRLARRNRPVYYYRSSICSTPAGSPKCADIERRLQLQPLAHTRLPARPSFPWTTYKGARVDVGLFRVRDAHR